jgi:hypothetical protein
MLINGAKTLGVKTQPRPNLAGSDESFEKQGLEVMEQIRVHPIKQFQEILRQLKGGGLEAQIAGRIGQHESKVNVHQMPRPVEQDISVVAIFDLYGREIQKVLRKPRGTHLQEIADQRIRRQAVHKVFLGHQKRLVRCSAKFLLKISAQRGPYERIIIIKLVR